MGMNTLEGVQGSYNKKEKNSDEQPEEGRKTS